MNQKPKNREQLLEKLLELQNKIAELESTQSNLFAHQRFDFEEINA